MLSLTTSRSFTLSESKQKDKKKENKPLDHQQIVYKTSNGIELSKDQLTKMSIFHIKQVHLFFCLH